MISGIDYDKGNDESCAITFVSPEYIEQLEQENKKYKEVIDKIRKEINEEYSIMGVEVVENWVLKDILKEVE